MLKIHIFKTFSLDDSNVTVHVQITRQLLENHMTVTLSDFWLTNPDFEKTQETFKIT